MFYFYLTVQNTQFTSWVLMIVFPFLKNNWLPFHFWLSKAVQIVVSFCNFFSRMKIDEASSFFLFLIFIYVRVKCKRSNNEFERIASLTIFHVGCAQLDVILTLFFNGATTPLRSDLLRQSVISTIC
jgi:hypothetical protein